jgi:hypothetical protein
VRGFAAPAGLIAAVSARGPVRLDKDGRASYSLRTMALALIVCNLLAALALVTAGVAGLESAHDFLPLDVYPRLHVMLALFASLLVLFGHSMTMFYFIGTGVRMKELVAEHRIEEDLITPTRRFKQRVFPWATLAMALTMVAFILGGGVDTGNLPSWIHLILALLAIGVNFVALQHEISGIHANVRLFDHLDALVVARGAETRRADVQTTPKESP